MEHGYLPRKRKLEEARNHLIEAVECLREACIDTRCEGEVKERVEPDVLAAALFLHNITLVAHNALDVRPWNLPKPNVFEIGKLTQHQFVFDYLCAKRQGFSFNPDGMSDQTVQGKLYVIR